MYGRSKSYLCNLDSGCLRHIIGDRSKFLFITPTGGDQVIFGNNSQGKVIGKGHASNIYIDNVFLVKRLRYNLLNISQFCDKGNKVKFDSNYYIVENQNDKQIKLICKGINNIYMIYLENKPYIDSKYLV